MGSQTGSANLITLKNDEVQVVISVTANGAVLLQDILPAKATPEKPASPYSRCPALPLCEVRLSGEGNPAAKTSKALIGSYVSSRLRYQAHHEDYDANAKTRRLDVRTFDEVTRVTVTSHLVIFDGLPFVRSSATLRNDGQQDVVVSQISSLVVGGLTKSRKEWWSDFVVSVPNNTWFREAQWKDVSLPDAGVDDFGIYGMPEDYRASLASFTVSNRGTFSTQGHLPMGMLKRRDGAETWLWQIENNGSWRWDIGDYEDSVYLAACGPNANDHEWRQRLSPGASFTSATAAVCHLFDDADAAFASVTQYRRAIRRKHADHQSLPIIFNDYMNCLMGDPTEEKILALLDPVAKSGAEYFVIDCGWYADDSNWWDDVGLWEPSKKRFPNGFKELLAKIRAKGLKPGLWLEPEVVGIRSVVAEMLPSEAFWQRDGARIVEKGRYHLDYRHPDVRKRMDKVVDTLVLQYGARYFKFDYNVEITQGTDVNCSSAGVGQLEHNRAYLAWVAALYDRHPGLLIENCSSGAQRMDYASLSVYGLQSTSDQQDPARYAAIAAAIPTAATPEQGATWAYPQPEWSDEINALTVVNSLLGRIHLSGRLDTIDPGRLKLIYDGMSVYKSIRGDIATSLPFWPLGLPAWHDEWLALGLKAVASDGSETGRVYIAIWRRGGGGEGYTLPVHSFKGKSDVTVELLYPQFKQEASWDAQHSSLRVQFPRTVCARLYRLQAS